MRQRPFDGPRILLPLVSPRPKAIAAVLEVSCRRVALDPRSQCMRVSTNRTPETKG